MIAQETTYNELHKTASKIRSWIDLSVSPSLSSKQYQIHDTITKPITGTQASIKILRAIYTMADRILCVIKTEYCDS